jgi:enoyl-CoA hydratase/carnithine racemase
MSDSSQTAAVLCDLVAEHIALVTINRTAARNAINCDVANELSALVDQLEHDPEVWVVILTGAGDGVFCAGADLKEVAAGRGLELFNDKGFAGFVDAKRCKPWIAAVNGKAFGGGFEIVLACDLVVANTEAEFALPEVSRGLIAAAGGLFRLPRAIPRNIAIEMAVTADRMGVERAHALGLVNHITSKTDLVPMAVKLAQKIARNAPLAVRESLSVVRASADLDEDALKTLSWECRNRIAQSEDYKEGPRAFVEKREPRWSGK